MSNKPKPLFSLSAMPDNILALVLIFGIGSVFGLLLYASFEMNKKTISAPKEVPNKTDEYFGNAYIKIKSPQKNSVTGKPVQITGKANVFEANVRVRMKDEMQNILIDTFITAEGAYDGLYPFEQAIDYTTPSSRYMVMEVFEESPRDGTEINKVIIPLVYKDFIDISEWEKYENNTFGYEVKYPEDWELTDSTGSKKFILSETEISPRPADPEELSPKFQISVVNKKNYYNFSNGSKMPQANSYLNSYPVFIESYNSDSGPETYYLEKGDVIIILNMIYGENIELRKESKAMVNRILSTFKVIEE